MDSENQNNIRDIIPIVRSAMIEILHGQTGREERYMALPNEIDDVFTYHAPTPEQAAGLEQLRMHLRAAAHAIQRFTPESPYRTVAFRKLHEANMYASAAIVLQGRSLR